MHGQATRIGGSLDSPKSSENVDNDFISLVSYDVCNHVDIYSSI